MSCADKIYTEIGGRKSLVIFKLTRNEGVSTCCRRNLYIVTARAAKHRYALDLFARRADGNACFRR